MQSTSTGPVGGRPMILATRGVVSAGHYLASEAGISMLRQGGNAMDAAAAAGFVMAVVSPEQNGLAGEVPMLVYSARDKAVWAVNGNGCAPQLTDIETFRRLGLNIVPGDGLLPAVVPAVVASWIQLLRRFGRLRLAQVLAPAIELADGGFVVYDALHGSIATHAEKFRRDWPTSAAAFLPGGKPLETGTVWRQPAMARTLRTLAKADARCRGRQAGLRAAHDEFYRGSIARKIDHFCKTTSVKDISGWAHSGLLRFDDLADYEARVERPVSSAYRGFRVYKCGPWCQGPAMLEALNLLEGFDLKSMGHNSPSYIHTLLECVKLAYADREYYYGDPDFVRVPMARLLSKAYAARRRALIDPAVASMQLRPGDHPPIDAPSVLDVESALVGQAFEKGDTTSVQVADCEGNVVSAVPSGGWLMSSPMIPELGFPLGTRGQMFSLTAGHPNCLAGGKRPRTTLTPSLALQARGGARMAFGSPGGDCQDVWALQFFLNVVEFGMSLQEAVEAPTIWTKHFPNSFYPRTAEAGSLYAESRVTKDVLDDLASRGHRIKVQPAFSGGNVMTAAVDPRAGVLQAAASPRYNPGYAIGL